MYLTKRQKEILDYIVAFMGERGYAPTLEEIGGHFGLSSPATVYKHVQRLVQKGYLRKARHQGRGLEIVEAEPKRTIEAPLLGRLSAGRPLEANPTPQTVHLPPEFAVAGPTFVVRVQGDGLRHEELRDGDLLVVEDRTSASDGQTVLAVLPGEVATVGRVFRDPNGIRLQQGPQDREPLRYAEGQLQIRGVVIGLVRRYP